jgi:hypothetical protein
METFSVPAFFSANQVRLGSLSISLSYLLCSHHPSLL